MKKLATIFFVFFTLSAKTQTENIVMQNGKIIPVWIERYGFHNVYARVIEKDKVKIKKIKNKKIDYILLKNGDIKFVNSFWNSEYTTFGRNMFDVDVAGLKDKSFAFSYQRLSENGKIGVRFPFQFHLDNGRYQGYKEISYPNQFSKLRAGVDLNIYPWGQHIISYYFGFATSYSLVDVLNPNYDIRFADYKPYKYYRYDQRFLKNSQEVALCFQSGFMLRLNKNIFMDAGGGIGPCAYFVPIYRTMSVELYGHFSFGWAF